MFLIILMQFLEKLPQISGITLIVKVCPDPRQTDPQTFGGPLNRKILQALLVYHTTIKSQLLSNRKCACNTKD